MVTGAGVVDASTIRQPVATSVWLPVAAVAGGAAAAGSVGLAFKSDHVDQPGVQAALMAWMVLGYVLAGVVATVARPGRSVRSWSRPGSGSASRASRGRTGRCSSPSGSRSTSCRRAVPARDPGVPDRAPALATGGGLVGVGYVTAFALQIVGMVLGGFGEDNQLARRRTRRGDRLLHVQLVVLAGIAVISFVILCCAADGRPQARPSTRARNRFLLARTPHARVPVPRRRVRPRRGGQHVREHPPRHVRRARPRAARVPRRRAPRAFAAGVVGDLLLELRANPAPATPCRACARAARSVPLARVLAARLRGLRRSRRPSRQAAEVDPGRAMTEVERDGAPVAALLHDPSLLDEPELLDAVAATAGIALDNARLQSDLRARVDELRGVALPCRRRRSRRNGNGSNATCTTAPSNDWSHCRSTSAGSSKTSAPTTRPRLGSATPGAGRGIARRAPRPRAWPPPRSSAPTASPVALEELDARATVPVELTVDLDGRLPEPVEVAAYYVVSESVANVGKHAHARLRPSSSPRRDRVVVEVIDDGIGGADTERGSGLRGLADRVEALGVGSGSGPARTAAPVCGRRSRASRDRRGQRAAARRAGTAPRRQRLRCRRRLRGRRRLLSSRAHPGPDVAIVDIRLPPTHSDEGLAPRSRSAPNIRRSACSCSRSTSSSASL